MPDLTTLGHLAAWRLVRWAPERLSRSVFDLLARRLYAANGRSVRRLRGNLARVVTEVELERVTRDGVRSYLRYWCESFRLPSWPLDDLVTRTNTVDDMHLREAVSRGGGAVVALPHMGNWDWAGAWAMREVQQVMSVAERLEPQRLFDEFLAYRESIGIHVVALSGGEDALPQLESWVRDGGLVCLLADRDLSRSSVVVDLLGEPARVPVGPAVLAVRTGAPLVPVTLWYDGEGLTIRFHPAIEPAPEEPDPVTSMMQGVADAFTESILAHPVDWHMMQRVFVSDLDER